jgi:hypothetical protein
LETLDKSGWLCEAIRDAWNAAQWQLEPFEGYSPAGMMCRRFILTLIKKFGDGMMMKRIAAYALMIVGFVWIAGVCRDLFCAQHHTLWIWHSQNLTAGEMIPRTDAVDQMRKLELAIQDVYQPLVIPAGLILLGGILNGIGRRKATEPATPPCSGPATRSPQG